MLTVSMLQSRLRTIGYKDWRFRLDEMTDEHGEPIENVIMLTISMPNGDHGHLGWQSMVNRAMFDDLPDLEGFVWNAVCEFELNEASRQFTVAGLTPFAPK